MAANITSQSEPQFAVNTRVRVNDTRDARDGQVVVILSNDGKWHEQYVVSTDDGDCGVYAEYQLKEIEGE